MILILTLNLTFNHDFHIRPTFNPEFHIQPWIWFYILPWNLHLLVNCPIQLRTGYLTFKSHMDLNKRGGSHKVSRSTDGHNFFIFDPGAIYVGANWLNDSSAKFQVRSSKNHKKYFCHLFLFIFLWNKWLKQAGAELCQAQSLVW